MADLTFEQIPKIVGLIYEEVQTLKCLVQELRNAHQPITEKWFNVSTLREYLPDKPAKATVYSWVRNDKIPHYKDKGGRKLRFLKSEIDAWLLQGRKKTIDDINIEVDEFFKTK